MNIFTAIIAFVTHFFASLKKEYLNIEPLVKAQIDSTIKAGNIIKNYIANPSTAGLFAGPLIILLEEQLGTAIVSLISSVLSEVLIDLGIIDTALVDPNAAWQALLNHLASLKGKAFGNKLFDVIVAIVEKITTVFAGNQAKAIVAFVYDTFFSNTPAQIQNTVSAPVINLNQGEQDKQAA